MNGDTGGDRNLAHEIHREPAESATHYEFTDDPDPGSSAFLTMLGLGGAAVFALLGLLFRACNSSAP